MNMCSEGQGSGGKTGITQAGNIKLCIRLHCWITCLFNLQLWGKKSLCNMQEGLTAHETGENELLCLVICCMQK